MVDNNITIMYYYDVLPPYNGILCSNKKEKPLDIYNNLDGLKDIMLSEPISKGYLCFK